MNNRYLLDEGTEAIDRLALVQRIYGSGSRAMLLAAGSLEGRRVLELGCGTGSMTRWLAEQVGEGGVVVGADASGAQLEVARARCAGFPSVRFVCADASDTGLAPGEFDLVYLRLLLMHVPAPQTVLAHAHALLRPGGSVLCEEAAIDSTFTDPPLPEQRELHALANEMARERGCDFNVARRLGSLVRTAGFELVTLSAQQPVLLRGPEKRLEVASFEEAMQHWPQASDETRARGARVIASLASAASDEETVYGLSMMMRARGRKPHR